MDKRSPEELARLSPEAYRTADKLPLVLILDNIRSALNVGSAFRTADAFRVQAIALCGITAVPPHREILKTAIGATESVSWSHFEHTVQAIEHYRQAGYLAVAVEQTRQSVELQNFDIQAQGKYALVFGNEVGGVEQAALERVQAAVEIPQFGTKHSLNISVCLGIVLWEFFGKMQLKR